MGPNVDRTGGGRFGNGIIIKSSYDLGYLTVPIDLCDGFVTVYAPLIAWPNRLGKIREFMAFKIGVYFVVMVIKFQ